MVMNIHTHSMCCNDWWSSNSLHSALHGLPNEIIPCFEQSEIKLISVAYFKLRIHTPTTTTTNNTKYFKLQ